MVKFVFHLEMSFGIAFKKIESYIIDEDLPFWTALMA